MKLILPLLLIFCFSLKSQNIQGTWKCTKVLYTFKKDTSNWTNKNYLSLSYSFGSKGKFVENFSASNNKTTGKYSYNKSKKEITFSNLVWTHKYEGKVKLPSSSGKTAKSKNYVLKISKNQLILLEKGTPKSEAPGHTIYYFVR